MLKRILTAALYAAAASRLWADEGRTPIFKPTIITRPGDYVLTRDVVAAGDVAISIQASGVTLDLHGHTISDPSTSFALVGLGQGATDVTIRNGRLVGGTYGVLYGSGSPRVRVRLERLRLVGPLSTGIFISGAEEVEVLSCDITGGPSQPFGIYVVGVIGPFGGRFVDNSIETQGNDALYLDGFLGGEIRGNRITSATKPGAYGINLQGAPNTPHGGNLIEGNTVILGAANGIFLCGDCDSNVIIRNVVGGNGGTGIVAQSGGNRIAENVLAGNGSVGIGISGSRNLVEGNIVKDNFSCGVSFVGLGTENAYRNNLLRGNTGGAICGTATDAGGNILP